MTLLSASTTITSISARKGDGKNCAVLDLADDIGTKFHVYTADADFARQGIVAFVEALRILQPDAAERAVGELVDDLLAARPVLSDAECDRLHALIKQGQANGIVAPDVAQPEDIPAPSCRHCHATDVPLDECVVLPGEPVEFYCHNPITCQMRVQRNAEKIAAAAL